MNKYFLSKEELSTACNLTVEETDGMLKSYIDVIGFQTRQELIHTRLKKEYINPVMQNCDYRGLDTLCTLIPEILRQDLYPLRLQWSQTLSAQQPYTKKVLTKEEGELIYKNAGEFKQMYPGEPKKEAIKWLTSRLSTLGISVVSFVNLLQLCDEYGKLEKEQEKIGENLWDGQIKKVRDYLDFDKLRVLVDHLPPLYCRFQAAEILSYMESVALNRS
jgi:hypothetical protein